MKKILLIILVLVLAGGLYGYYQYNRKPAGVADQEAIKINAAALVATFMKDEKAAQALKLFAEATADVDVRSDFVKKAKI